jgi:hypothetical protein
MNERVLAERVQAALARTMEWRGAPPRRELESVRITHRGQMNEEEAAREIVEALYDLPGE